MVDKDRVAQAFLRGFTTYDEQATVQRKVNQRLLDALAPYIAREPQRVFEIGCGTGQLTQQILQLVRPTHLFVNDLVPEAYQMVCRRIAPPDRRLLEPCIGDVEVCGFPENLDLVVSSSTFQWLNDLSGVIERIGAALNRSGVLAFTMFGQGTMGEVTAFTGVGLEYPSLADINNLVSRRLTLLSSVQHEDQLWFKSPEDVLRHVQATGVAGVGGYRWTPRRFERFIDQYSRRYAKRGGVGLSYVSYICIAEKGY